jgi:excisionase family DNA binding protein
VSVVVPELGEQLLTPDLVAEHLSCPRNTVLDLYQRGELRGVQINRRVIRFRLDDVEAFVESRRSEPPRPRLVDQLPKRKAPTGPRRRRSA